jgi:hypothetical protein
MCQYLLDTGLTASRLPAAMQDHVRGQFKDRVFEPAELNAAIDEARKLISELSGGGVIQGPGRVSAMFNTDDQLQARWMTC